MAREDRGDEGLPPRVRLELREMPCGTPCAAAPEWSAVAHWWEDRWPVPPRSWINNVTRRCAIRSFGHRSGRGNAGPPCTCDRLSRTSVAGSPELKKVASVHLSGELPPPQRSVRAFSSEICHMLIIYASAQSASILSERVT
jgi:hypothetical protein